MVWLMPPAALGALLTSVDDALGTLVETIQPTAGRGTAETGGTAGRATCALPAPGNAARMASTSGVRCGMAAPTRRRAGAGRWVMVDSVWGGA